MALCGEPDEAAGGPGVPAGRARLCQRNVRRRGPPRDSLAVPCGTQHLPVGSARRARAVCLWVAYQWRRYRLAGQDYQAAGNNRWYAGVEVRAPPSLPRGVRRSPSAQVKRGGSRSLQHREVSACSIQVPLGGAEPCARRLRPPACEAADAPAPPHRALCTHSRRPRTPPCCGSAKCAQRGQAVRGQQAHRARCARCAWGVHRRRCARWPSSWRPTTTTPKSTLCGPTRRTTSWPGARGGCWPRAPPWCARASSRRRGATWPLASCS